MTSYPKSPRTTGNEAVGPPDSSSWVRRGRGQLLYKKRKIEKKKKEEEKQEKSMRKQKQEKKKNPNFVFTTVFCYQPKRRAIKNEELQTATTYP